MDIQWLLPMPRQMTASELQTPVNLALRAGDLLTASVLEVERGSDALLSFGRFKAYAQLPLPVVAGQDVKIRVEEAGQGLRMVMVPKSGMESTRPAGERLEISIFEPVPDSPLPAASSRSLVPGESFQGRITGFVKDGRMLVDFGKFKAFAKIDIPVRQGQTIALTVVRTEPGIAFALTPQPRPVRSSGLPVPTAIDGTPAIPAREGHPARTEMIPDAAAKTTRQTANPAPPPTGADMAVLRQQVQQMLHGAVKPQKTGVEPIPAPVKAALENLQGALSPALPAQDIASLAARIKGFVENSGLYFEKHLEEAIQTLPTRATPMTTPGPAVPAAISDLMSRDVKPNLLILKQFLDTQAHDHQGADRHHPEMLKSAVQRAVSYIEQQQFTATEKPADPDLFQAFSHLLFLADTRRDARLKVYYAKKGRDDAPPNPRVSLLLDMDRLGAVRTDLWMVGKDLNITFFVGKEAVKEAIETRRGRIGEALKDTFNTVALSVVVNERKIAEFEGGDLTIPNQRQVDLSI